MPQAFQLAPAPIYRGKKPIRSAQYLRFVKGFGRCACGSCRLVDPAHTGAHAYGRKACDLRVLPLCRKCHDAFDADPRGFAARHGLDIAGLIENFNRLWRIKENRRLF